MSDPIPFSHAATVDAGTALAGPPSRTTPSTEVGLPIGRFEPIRPHAQGGLGEVLLARDAELGRDVAFKRIRDAFADNPEMRGRFLREAEVTARLEHPGVVPVYGLVSDTHGRPHYAMRFIAGQSLARAVRELHADKRKPRDAYLSALRPLLTRFVAVCNAIAYAHSRGVIHRDLKPDNVMLGAFGETLVVDWGLAKVIGATRDESTNNPSTEDDALATREGETAGTPAYMPPEQAAGDWANISPAADIYSLGATLYAILTGSPPVSGASVLDTLAKVFVGELTPARQADHRVPSALAAVAHRAMALKPQDRYASAEEVGREVERWLADEPVTAYPDPVLTRLARAARRHKTAVAAVAVLLVATLFGLAAWGGLERNHASALRAEQEQTESRRQEAVANAEAARRNAERADANAATAEANAVTAKRNEETAKANAKRAEEQGQLALKTLTEVVGDFQSELANVPAARPLRVRWMQRALERMDKVVVSAAESANADHASIWALLEIGDIYRLAGNAEAGKDGKPTAEPGRWTERAKEVFGRAHVLAKRLADAAPTSAQAQRDLDVSLERLGDVSLQMGDAKAAQEAFNASHAISKRLAEADPTNSQAQRDLGVTLEKLGEVSLRVGDVKAALEAFNASHAIRRRRAEADPADAQAQRDLGVSHNNMGIISLRVGEVKAAQEAFNASLAIRKRLAEADPANALALHDLGVSHNYLGNISLQLGDLKAAKESYTAMHHVNRQVAEADPANTLAQRDLSISHEKLGEVSTRLDDFKAAKEAFSASLTIRKRLTEADPASVQAVDDLAISHFKLGENALALGDFADAHQSFAAAGKLAQDLFDAGKFPDQGHFKERMTDLTDRQVFCTSAIEACKSLDDALAQPKALQPRLLWTRIQHLARQKADPADIVATADALRKLAPKDAGFVYVAGRGYALAASVAKEDGEYGGKAVALLREAVELGLKDVAQLDTDTNLDALRQRDDFKKLLADRRAKPE